MLTASVYAKGDAVHAGEDAAEPPHPGPWTERVHAVVSDDGLHWIGRDLRAAYQMSRAVNTPSARVVTMDTGTAYVEGR